MMKFPVHFSQTISRVHSASLFLNRKRYLAYEFSNNRARGDGLGRIVTDDIKNKNYSQSDQLVRLVASMLSFSLASQLAH